MKGRTQWNKPSFRKTDVYKLLIKLGGNARWKHLKTHLKELGWGPTTLKQTLDEMVNEGSVTKEAIAGDEGPEVWYKIRIGESAVWKLFQEFLKNEKGMPTFEEIMQAIQKRAQKREKNEREGLLRGELRELFETARELYTVQFCLGADEMIYRPEGASTYINYGFEFLKDETIKYMQVFREYREISASLVVDMLNEVAAKYHSK